MKKIYIITNDVLPKIIYNKQIDIMSIKHYKYYRRVNYQTILYLTNISYKYSPAMILNYFITYMKIPNLDKINTFNINLKFKIL